MGNDRSSFKPHLDPKGDIFKWGPIPMRLFLPFANCLNGMFVYLPKIHPGYSWPSVLILVQGTQLVWMHDFPQLRRNAGRLFLDHMLPKDKRKKTRELWQKACADLHKLENGIQPRKMASLSDSEVLTLWNEFHKKIDIFWGYSNIPELSNYGSTEILAERLSHHVPEKERASVMEILTAPEGLSFYQEEEIELAETRDLSEHQKKYQWIKNSFAKIEIASVEFFIERQKKLSKNLRQETMDRLRFIRQEKENVRDRYDVPEEVMNIAQAIADGIVWQDARKKEVWIYMHHENLLVDEICRRRNIRKEDLLLLTHGEVTDLLGGAVHIEQFRARSRGFGLYYDDDGNHTWIPSEKIPEYWKTYATGTVDTSTREFKGIVACKGSGLVSGTVRIILDPRAVDDFKKGDILVTTMTTPEYVFVMKEAAAVVTDTGGLTSHAAIISRELSLPCIVGTKVATQVLKDGDMVEVDAERGIVRIIQKI
ncbi:MAG TPA: PEP-utilizing enzyme [Candidatus Paceibacterota bacterium]